MIFCNFGSFFLLVPPQLLGMVWLDIENKIRTKKTCQQTAWRHIVGISTGGPLVLRNLLYQLDSGTPNNWQIKKYDVHSFAWTMCSNTIDKTWTLNLWSWKYCHKKLFFFPIPEHKMCIGSWYIGQNGSKFEGLVGWDKIRHIYTYISGSKAYFSKPILYWDCKIKLVVFSTYNASYNWKTFVLVL